MQAPTDNLYKFMAIAGLICFLFFYFDYSKRYVLLNESINSARMDTAVISAKIEAYRGKQSYVQQRIKEAERDNLSLEVYTSIRKSWEDNLPGLDELVLLQAKNVQSVEIIKESRAELDWLFRIYLGLGMTSLLLCLYGMYLWYFRTQRFLDLKEKNVVPPRTKSKFRETLPNRK
ncbi:hypothetical protein [Pseudomonas sp. NC02]|uniref:hypothetical protein n=1 Tax=Pseudomonas sp. NC02 TaxID=2067572 RepID=UPI000C84303D|nr:hypothetical protein [Pseudomonas sp. NC02]AUO23203.1 hypothetical protein C0058_14915 [Pseudomonas sp. NC02]